MEYPLQNLPDLRNLIYFFCHTQISEECQAVNVSLKADAWKTEVIGDMILDCYSQIY